MSVIPLLPNEAVIFALLALSLGSVLGAARLAAGRGLAWTVVLLLLISSLPAWGTPLNTNPKRGGTLKLALASDIVSLDPAAVYNWLEGSLALMIYCPLLDYDENENLIPRLAEALPEVSDDGLTYTFRLRPGVRFSNGREMVAEDVAYSLERHLDPKFNSSYGPYYLNIAGAEAFKQARSAEGATAASARPPGGARWIEPTRWSGIRALDRHTLEIRLRQPDFIFADVMATPYSLIVPREEVEKHGSAFGRHPVGAGPFVLKEWTRGVRLRLERNPDYYVPHEPYLDAVEVMIGVDDTTEIMMFERGQIDFVHSVQPGDFIRVQRDPRFESMRLFKRGTGPNYIALNCEIPPFDDVRVRQAMNYAVNKERVLKALQHRGVAARGVLPPSVKGYNPELAGYPYDPGKAKALLASAGHAKGFKVELWVSDVATWRQLAAVVQQDLREVGITVELKPVNGAAMFAAQQRGKVAMSIWDWLATFNDPKDTLDTQLNGERITERDCLNVAFYSNPRVNELFRRADAERNAGRRLAIYRELEERVVEDAPWIFLYHANRYQLRQPTLRGMRSRAVWPNRFEQAWFEK